MNARSALWRLFLPLLLVLPAMVACGGFQIRVTPAASPSPQANRAAAAATRTPAPPPTATVAPTRPPTATPSVTPTPVAGLAPGKSARVSASGGVNMRDKPNSAAKLLGRLGPDITVSIKDGPTNADGFTWWLVDDGSGNVGWVAAGTKDDPWLAPEKGSAAVAGGGKLVNRAVRLGDRVQVTTQEGKMLTLREVAGTSSAPTARALTGTQFTVRSGPVRQDGYLWWELEGEQVKGWGAEGEEGDRWLTPVEQ